MAVGRNGGGRVKKSPDTFLPVRSRRRAMILVVVLVVVALLSLAAYTFAQMMLTQYEAAKLSGRQVQSRALVESGAEAVRLFLMQDQATRDEAGGILDNPSYFQAIPVLLFEDLTQRANFTVLVPNLDDDANLVGLRYGLEDESVRLNVNALLEADKILENAGRDLLMGLPGMTIDVADAIMDWIDEDDEPREYGAESQYYQGLRPPYLPKNGPLDTVEELLLVRGVTPQLLFGRDTNRNGMLDPFEVNPTSASPAMPGASTLPTLDEGGSLDRGWVGYLTLHSAEKNVNAQGMPRINVNTDDLQTLYDDVTAVLNEDWAKFIVLYRQHGPYDGTEAGEDVVTVPLPDLTAEGGTKLTQVLDLVGRKVQVPGQGDGEGTVVAPAFPDALESMMVYLPILVDNLTVSDQAVIPGRININQTPRAILVGIPGLEESAAGEILNQRSLQTGEAGGDLSFAHETWLLTAGIVTLEEMRTLLPFVCAGGDVFRAQIVGYYEDGGTASRAEVIFDATGPVPAIVSWRDISHLGRGYPLELLGVQLISGL
jgi:hypothetical protein